MSKKKKVQIDSRTARHKRRIRNVILSYIVLVILVGGIATGGFFGVKAVAGAISDKKAKIAAEEAAIEAERKAAQEAEMAAVLEASEAEAEEEVPEEVVEEEYTEEDLLDEVVQSCISDMSLEDKVAGLFIITPEQLTGQNKVTKAGDGTKSALEEHPVGGIIYSADNIKDESQTTEMLANTVSYSRYPIFLAVKEGLGSDNVVRKALKLDEIKSAKELAEAGEANLTYESYKQIGEYLTTCGFNLTLAPTADIAIEGVDSKEADAMFGGDVTLASNLLASSVEGLKEAGTFSCIKHFPGQGSVAADTEKELADTARSQADFKNNDIAVFQAGIEAGADMVMVGNFKAPELTGDETTPCFMSKEVMTELLRGEYQYDGVIITDALNTPSVTDYYTSDEIAVKSLKAGADMLLMPEDFEAAFKAVVEAVNEGTISEQRINDSLARVYRIKYRSTIAE